jgi:hypothetical protein
LNIFDLIEAMMQRAYARYLESCSGFVLDSTIIVNDKAIGHMGSDLRVADTQDLRLVAEHFPGVSRHLQLCQHVARGRQV